MADINDLEHTSILDMSNDESIELLRQIRLSRRVPEKRSKKKATKPASKVTVDASLAAEILKLLES